MAPAPFHVSTAIPVQNPPDSGAGMSALPGHAQPPRTRQHGAWVRRALLCLGLVPALLAAGCTVAAVLLPAAAGAGNLAYSEYRDGEYVLPLAAGRAVCEAAVRQSCRHFGLVISSWRTDAQCTEALLRNARGDRFRIWLADVGRQRTALYIRVGLWGDDLCSRQLAGDIAAGVDALQPGGQTACRR